MIVPVYIYIHVSDIYIYIYNCILLLYNIYNCYIHAQLFSGWTNFCIHLHANDIQHVHLLYDFLKMSIWFKLIHICNIFYPSRYENFSSNVLASSICEHMQLFMYELNVWFYPSVIHTSVGNHATSVINIFYVAITYTTWSDRSCRICFYWIPTQICF